MRYQSIKAHLRPYSIKGRRTTTINHAFAAAIAPSDAFDDSRVREAITVLGQDPDAELVCVYCDEPAETWDHIFSTVLKSRFSGHGHRLGNLIPCCKPCNSKKGNKKWSEYLTKLESGSPRDGDRRNRIGKYVEKFSVADIVPVDSVLHNELENVRQKILELISEADELASKIRATGLSTSTSLDRKLTK